MDQIGFHPAASTSVHLNVKTNTVTLSMDHVYMDIHGCSDPNALTIDCIGIFLKLQITNLECINIKHICDFYKLEKKLVKITLNLSYESTVSQLFY